MGLRDLLNVRKAAREQRSQAKGDEEFVDIAKRIKRADKRLAIIEKQMDVVKRSS